MITLKKYTEVFDSTVYTWTKDREYNLTFLRVAQNYYNRVLRVRGYVFLRDIYEYIGFPLTKASLTVGWVYDSENTNNHIDFGIRHTEGSDFQLDFNVSGDITGYFKD